MTQPPEPTTTPLTTETKIPVAPPVAQSRPLPIAHHHEFAEMVQSLLTIIVIATFVTTFLFQPHRIPSSSMEPTLLVGDFLLVTKNSWPAPWYSPLPHTPIHRGQVIVFLKPDEQDTHLVKRVIGVPGDHIHLDPDHTHPYTDHVFLNGVQLTEPYAVYRGYPGTLYRDYFPNYADLDASVLPKWLIQLHHDTAKGDLIVPPHMYFALGDNRNNSTDSRWWGFVPEQNIIGTPWLVYFSLRNSNNLPEELSEDEAALPAQPDSLTNRVVTRIANYARWSRIFHLVQ